MAVRNPRWLRLAVAGGLVTAAVAGTPGRAGAQACSAGPLSAYLASAGLGCTFGQLRMQQFGSTAFSSVASQVFINPFTLQGPPGYTWVGFSVRFASGLAFAREAPLDFSFWSTNAPLYGLLAHHDIAGLPTYGGSLRTRLTGDGGVYRVRDRISSTLARAQDACASSGGPFSCTPGTARTGALADGDQAYQVEAASFLATSQGTPYDYTVAVLADQATVAPEPATVLLLSSGLGGVGAIVRRRRKARAA